MTLYRVAIRIEDETGRSTEVLHEPHDREKLVKLPCIGPAVLAHEAAGVGARKV